MLRWSRTGRGGLVLRPGCRGEGSGRIGLRLRPQGRDREERLLLTRQRRRMTCAVVGHSDENCAVARISGGASSRGTASKACRAK